MKTFEFMLTVHLADTEMDTDELIERLGQAGCADALIGVGKPGEVALDFCREADSLDAATSSAIADVQRAIPHAVLTRLNAHEAAPRPVQANERLQTRV